MYLFKSLLHGQKLIFNKFSDKKDFNEIIDNRNDVLCILLNNIETIWMDEYIGTKSRFCLENYIENSRVE